MRADRMRAMVQEEHGTDLRSRTLPVPTLQPGQVRVEVEVAGLNHLDLWLRRGGTGDELTLPRVPGSDVLGTVRAVGDAVTGVRPGQRVLLYPGRACERCEHCRQGRQSACREFRVMGYGFDGGYAEQVVAEEPTVMPVPDSAGPEWGAVPVAYVTAWNALVTKAGLRPGETVVVWGASGGLGHAALRIAVGLGAEPVAVVGDQGKVDWLRAQGYAGQVVVRDDQVRRQVKRLTGGRGADVVLDHVGQATWMESIRMLTTGGRLACCGVTSGYEAVTDLRHVFGKQLSVHGSWMGDRGDLERVLAFLADRPEALPVVDRAFPLEEANAAQEHLARGHHAGKLVLRVR